ncbi:MAG TPA: N-methyl-L-tryptophan oxidase [Candidatus Eremiobacteraceae bacterium]|nr:N-methyl-L-tryptophan oxidase [Candidatus Eremiobacteraceae bacterium]
MKAAVIGAGIVGACTAHELAKSGAEVTLFEQFDVDHDRGSSYGDSRIMRRFYDDPYYTQLMTIAYPLWRSLERAVGETLFERLGGLYFGPRDHPRLHSALDGMRAIDPHARFTEAAELRARFPAFAFADGDAGIVDDDAGSLRASRCVRAAVHAAVDAGARLNTGARVASIERRDGAIVLSTENERGICFDRAAVCAGPWTAKLLPQTRTPVRVTRQQYVHLRPVRDRAFFQAGAMPIFIEAGVDWYGFPEHGDVEGVKIACHQFGPVVDPDDVPRDIDDDTIARTRVYVRGRLPALAGGDVTFAKTCLYTVSPDEDFIVDVVPGIEGCCYVTGCSGHAFKFGTLLGAVAADLALDREPRADIARFRAARFAA